MSFSFDVELKSIEVTTRNLNSHRTFSKTEPEKGWATGAEYQVRRKVDEYTFSFEVWVYSDEELAYFRALAHEYLEYQRRLSIPPYDEIVAEDLAEVRKEIVESFGSDVSLFTH
jgi:hypothetical protein